VTPASADRWDVAVVGAGPAGCACAYHLARRGRRVLVLDRSRFPRDKACGDGLTAPSVALLAEMGLSGALSAHPQMRGVRICANQRSRRDFSYHSTRGAANPLGVVIPRYELDFLLTRRVLEAGAMLWEQSTAIDVRQGDDVRLRVSRAAGAIDVPARFVVLADGGGSGLAARAGLPCPDPLSAGFAVRGYYTLPDPCADFFEVHVPLVDPVSDGALAGYGWIFPVRETLANVGVGFFPTCALGVKPNLRRMLARFLDDLAARDSRFSRMHLESTLRGARLPSGVTPDACHRGRVLLAGDAAGLVDPFTGEGIDSALESGRLAAEVLDSVLDTPDGSPVDLHAYGRGLEDRFGEHFRIGRRFVKTYGFMWKVLEETFHVDSRLFDGLRRAAIDFGTGPRELYGSSDRDWTILDRLDLRRDFELMAARLRLLLRSENPIFAKIARNILDRRGSFVRLALLHISRRSGAADDVDAAASAATAIELSQLALEIQRDVLESGASGATTGGGISWANRFAITAGNCLLVEAYKLLTALDNQDIVRCVSAACGEVCVGMLERFGEFDARQPPSIATNIRFAAQTNGSVFAMCCEVGALLGGSTARELRALVDFGRRIGISYQLEQESAALAADTADLHEHPLAQSLRRRSLPFAVAWTIEHRPEDGLADILEAPTAWDQKVETTLRIVRANGSLERARAESLAYRAWAVRDLDMLQGAKRAALFEIAGEGIAI